MKPTAANSGSNDEQKSQPLVPKTVPIVSFEELATGREEVLIEFSGQIYRLRATRNGRLLLNK